MKFSKKLTIAFIVLSITLIVLFVVPYFANIVMPWQKSNAIKTALGWVGISRLPPHAKNVSVKTKGSMFTRQFILEFYSDSTEFKDWIQQVPKIKGSPPTMLTDATIEYEVRPGENGSNGGTIKLNKLTGQVIIDVSQS